MAQTLRFPWFFLLLDGIGTVLLGVGLAEWFAAVELVPQALRIEPLGPILVGVGLALMLPALASMLRQLIKAKAGQ
ncbi:hypothetical protein SAMN05216214_11728 [Atopomonas hussainii]|uniref:Uncharacterized protein n=1 Tax=Atopomonas hussainii TaxID=1429083 RepID=A0A1H7S4I5_9GAMM|nr:hypothetical protein [Atopomonas hussainii]SEL67405.1 hypothetical protein SAMN05216214_11728 [Atopomonas hussainii]